MGLFDTFKLNFLVYALNVTKNTMHLPTNRVVYALNVNKSIFFIMVI